MIEIIAKIDEDIFLMLHHLSRGGFMDMSMWLTSNRWIWVPMYIALAWWIMRNYGWQRGLIILCAIGLAVTFADQICASVIRPAVERLRPSNPANPLSDYVDIVNNYRGGRYGFPSCHASNTFVLATFVSLMCRNRWVVAWMFVWALMNCFSRIYLGVHYPGDLIVGATVGATFGFVMWAVARWASCKLNVGVIERRTVSWRTLFAAVGYVTAAVIMVVSFF